jgi:hypothetical protein
LLKMRGRNGWVVMCTKVSNHLPAKPFSNSELHCFQHENQDIVPL